MKTNHLRNKLALVVGLGSVILFAVIAYRQLLSYLLLAPFPTLSSSAVPPP